MADDAIILCDESGRDYRVTISNERLVTVDTAQFGVAPARDGSVVVTGAEQALVWTAAVDDVRWAFVNGEVFMFEVQRPSAPRRRAATHHAALMAPMPATVRKLLVGPGDTVRKGDVLLVLEAMKMELPIRANSDAQVDKVNCREGDLVQPGVSLIELDQ